MSSIDEILKDTESIEFFFGERSSDNIEASLKTIDNFIEESLTKICNVLQSTLITANDTGNESTNETHSAENLSNLDFQIDENLLNSRDHVDLKYQSESDKQHVEESGVPDLLARKEAQDQLEQISLELRFLRPAPKLNARSKLLVGGRRPRPQSLMEFSSKTHLTETARQAFVGTLISPIPSTRGDLHDMDCGSWAGNFTPTTKRNSRYDMDALDTQLAALLSMTSDMDDQQQGSYSNFFKETPTTPSSPLSSIDIYKWKIPTGPPPPKPPRVKLDVTNLQSQLQLCRSTGSLHPVSELPSPTSPPLDKENESGTECKGPRRTSKEKSDSFFLKLGMRKLTFRRKRQKSETDIKISAPSNFQHVIHTGINSVFDNSYLTPTNADQSTNASQDEQEAIESVDLIPAPDLDIASIKEKHGKDNKYSNDLNNCCVEDEANLL